MSIVILHGPQGCGKALLAPLVARRYGCTRIVDEWSGTAPLCDGDLAVTNTPPPYRHLRGHALCVDAVALAAGAKAAAAESHQR